MSRAVAATRVEVARLRAAAEHQQRDLDAGKHLGREAEQAKWEIMNVLKDAAELEQQADETERRLYKE